MVSTWVSGSTSFGSSVGTGSTASAAVSAGGAGKGFLGVVTGASFRGLYSISIFGWGGRWAKGSGGAWGRALISPSFSKVR